MLVCTQGAAIQHQLGEKIALAKYDYRNKETDNSTRYVSYKDLKALMADLKAVYAAVDESSALDALETFAEHWDKKYPKTSAPWGDNWPNLRPMSSIPKRYGG